MTPATSDAGRVVLTYKAYVVKHRNGDSVGFGADPSGMWVNRADHAATLSALQRKLDAVEKLARELLDCLPELECQDVHHRKSDIGHAHDFCPALDRLNTSRDSLRALLGGDGEGG